LRMVKAALDPLYVRSEDEFDRFIKLHEYHEQDGSKVALPHFDQA
jgi:hypothetical protein